MPGLNAEFHFLIFTATDVISKRERTKRELRKSSCEEAKRVMYSHFDQDDDVVGENMEEVGQVNNFQTECGIPVEPGPR